MITTELLDYIRAQKVSGTDEEVVKQKLSEIGWQNQDIEEAFEKIQPPTESKKAYLPFEIHSDIEYSSSLDIGIIQQPISVKNFVEHKIEDNKIKGEKHGKKLNIIWLLIIVIIVLLIGSGYLFYTIKPTNSLQIEKDSSPTPVAEQKSESKIVSDKNNKFKITIPSNWTIDDRVSEDLGMKIISSEEIKIADALFHPSITIINESVPGMGLDEYTEKNLKGMQASIEGFNLIKRSEVMVKNRQGIMLESNYVQGMYKIHDLQLILKDGDVFYVITGSNLDDYWIRTQDQLNQALMSFEII